MKGSTIGLILLGLIIVGVIWYAVSRSDQSASTNTLNTNTVNQNATNLNTVPPEDRQFDTSNTSTTNTEVVPPTNTTTSPQPVTMNVVITSSGLSPSSPTITAGTTIMFQNNDSRTHEIASNPHPSHSDLPGFDLSISAGGTGVFTFTRTGSWGYHDHLQPDNTAFQGTITVQ